MDVWGPQFSKRNWMRQDVYSLYVRLSCGSGKILWDGHHDNRDVNSMHCIRATCQVALRAAAVSTLDRLKAWSRQFVQTINNNKFWIISASMTHDIYITRRVLPLMCRISQYLFRLISNRKSHSWILFPSNASITKYNANYYWSTYPAITTPTFSHNNYPKSILKLHILLWIVI